ncbi:MAG: energy-coupling factor transporter transmembrane component T [Candidatus Hodarchaeales archaeon]|jgi:energy-coupling factor transport system permease protein
MSWTRSIDPRVKLAYLFLGTALILLAPSLMALVVIESLLVLLILDHRIFKNWLRLLRTTGLLLVTIWGINYYLVTSGDLLASSNAVIRIFSFFTLFFLFSSSVEPDMLAQALVSLKVPYSFSWQLATAYRFIPVFEAESRRIVEAQLSRGAPLDHRLIPRLRSSIALVIPFLTGTLTKSDQLAEALVTRAWNPHAPRTNLFPLQFSACDYIAVLILSALVVVIFVSVLPVL